MALPSPLQLAPNNLDASPSAATTMTTRSVGIPAFLDPAHIVESFNECSSDRPANEANDDDDSGEHSAPLTPPVSLRGTPAGVRHTMALTSGILAAHRRKQPLTPGAVLRALPPASSRGSSTPNTTPQQHPASVASMTPAAEESAPMRALMMSSIGSWPGCSLVAEAEEASTHETVPSSSSSHPPHPLLLLPVPVVDTSDDGAPHPRPVVPSEHFVSPPAGAWCRDGHPLEDLFA